MTRKSKIKTTLDTLFTGGKISSSETKTEQEKKPIPEKSVEQDKKTKSPSTNRKAAEVNNAGSNPEKSTIPEPILEKASEISKEEKPAAEDLTGRKSVTLPEANKQVAGKMIANAEQAIRIASEIDNAKISEGDDDEHLVIFSLGKELYGVTIHAVESIIKMQDITEVPRTEDFVLGVTNLRGTVVPVLDLRRRFNMANIEDTLHTRIIIINSDNAKVGIVVDEVTEVLKVAQKTIQPPPPMSTTVESAYINGIARINDSLVILLDLEKILQSSSRKFNR